MALWLTLAALAAPAWAGSGPASISGAVRDSAGVGQMGAVIDISPAAGGPGKRVYADERGQYSAGELPAGKYRVRATASAFLPSLRENVQLAAGAHQLVNLTLNTLFEAIQLLPQRRGAATDDEEWKWTLRSVGNRPILRVLDDGQSVVVASSEREDDRRLKAHVTFVGGAEAAGFGSSADASTHFSLEQSMFSSGTLAFRGNVGYGNGTPGGVIRASYAQQMGSSRPEIALTARRFARGANAPQYGALEAFSLTASNTMTVTETIEITAGSEFQTVQFARHVSTLRPFGTVDVHLTPDTVLEYRYASSQPSAMMRAAKGFDTAPADLTEAGPRMSLEGDRPVLERARHQELSLSRRFGNTRLQAAGYIDHVADAALVGVGNVSGDTGDFLPDVYSSTFTWNGGNLDTSGARLVLQHRFSDELTATLAYATGGVIAIGGEGMDWHDMQRALRNERRHAIAAKFSGRLPRSGTRWMASYRWTNDLASGGHALTPVDWFDASPGQADPYFSVFIRQPVPAMAFLPEHMELLVDVRNLLAQGYVPVVGRDGQTLYLVQAARSVRGGVAFSF
ncbi:MAG: carboxypeptidase-like regulatory domain-containing protein [Acidobacteriota bacterium]|nr:carboxypeptidase-like regulatory domain-containing protein [Acidobacteriota bacterium]